MIALALGLGVLGIFALRRARRRCHGAGYYGYGWHGPDLFGLLFGLCAL